MAVSFLYNAYQYCSYIKVPDYVPSLLLDGTSNWKASNLWANKFVIWWIWFIIYRRVLRDVASIYHFKTIDLYLVLYLAVSSYIHPYFIQQRCCSIEPYGCLLVMLVFRRPLSLSLSERSVRGSRGFRCFFVGGFYLGVGNKLVAFRLQCLISTIEMLK